MAFHYQNLDIRTRRFMIREMETDISLQKFRVNPLLNEEGVKAYPALLREAIQSYDDGWLANKLRAAKYIKEFEVKAGSSVKVSESAADAIAESDFNHYYMRGVCIKAIEDNVKEVEVYRGKQIPNPRPESMAVIGKRLSPQALLEVLRRPQDLEPALGLPAGQPPSLTVRLCRR